MKTTRRCFVFRSLALLLFAVTAQAADLERFEIEVDGVKREALVYASDGATKRAKPLVFAWHGHGGSMQQSARSFRIHEEWPDAIVIYPQGLNTPGRLTDPEGKKSGWQHGAGVLGDRDLKFFDALLAKAKERYTVDTNRVYSTGHSNGGGFSYLLWEMRPDIFAAFAPSGAVSKNAMKLKPKPAMHIAGDNDPLVKFEWQRLTMNALRGVNGCEKEGQPWEKVCTLYPSKNGTPFVSFIQSGGHKYPAEAPALIVKFFQQHPASE